MNAGLHFSRYASPEYLLGSRVVPSTFSVPLGAPIAPSDYLSVLMVGGGVFGASYALMNGRYMWAALLAGGAYYVYSLGEMGAKTTLSQGYDSEPATSIRKVNLEASASVDESIRRAVGPSDYYSIVQNARITSRR